MVSFLADVFFGFGFEQAGTQRPQISTFGATGVSHGVTRVPHQVADVSHGLVDVSHGVTRVSHRLFSA
jgi:hypothetical protein